MIRALNYIQKQTIILQYNIFIFLIYMIYLIELEKASCYAIYAYSFI